MYACKLSNYALCSLATMKDDFRRHYEFYIEDCCYIVLTHPFRSLVGRTGPKIIYVRVVSTHDLGFFGFFCAPIKWWLVVEG